MNTLNKHSITSYIIAVAGTDTYVGNNSSFKLGCADCMPQIIYTSNRADALTFPSMVAASVWAFMALPNYLWSVHPL